MFGKQVDLLNFKETGQQLQVNQTNAEFLIDNFGDDPEKYTGKQVTLFLAEYEYGGKKGKTIRLKRPGTNNPTAKEGVAHGDGAANPPPGSANRGADIDDEIPF